MVALLLDGCQIIPMSDFPRLVYMAWLHVNPNSDFSTFRHFFGRYLSVFLQTFGRFSSGINEKKFVICHFFGFIPLVFVNFSDFFFLFCQFARHSDLIRKYPDYLADVLISFSKNWRKKRQFFAENLLKKCQKSTKKVPKKCRFI